MAAVTMAFLGTKTWRQTTAAIAVAFVGAFWLAAARADDPAAASPGAGIRCQNSAGRFRRRQADRGASAAGGSLQGIRTGDPPHGGGDEGERPQTGRLLQQAFAQSKERQIDLQFEDVVKLLEKEQLYQANKGQLAVQQDLNRLLQLLLSGEREKQIANERVELKKFIERINKLIRQQQGIQGETDGQGDVPDLTKRQTDVADKTGELATRPEKVRSPQ